MNIKASALTALRWVLVLPAAVVGMYLAKGFGQLCVSGALSFIDPVPDWAYQIGRAFASPFGFAWTGAIAAPTHNRRVGAVLAAGWSLFYLGFLLHAFQNPDHFEAPEGLGSWVFIICVTLATLGGSAVAILTVRKDQDVLT